MPKKSFSVLFNDKIKVFNKIVDVDPDKSISIRSFLISAISNNISKISNALNSDDVKSCIRCLQILGVKIKKKNGSDYLVFGKGLGSLYSKKNQVLKKYHTLIKSYFDLDKKFKFNQEINKSESIISSKSPLRI